MAKGNVIMYTFIV